MGGLGASYPCVLTCLWPDRKSHSLMSDMFSTARIELFPLNVSVGLCLIQLILKNGREINLVKKKGQKVRSLEYTTKYYPNFLLTRGEHS